MLKGNSGAKVTYWNNLEYENNPHNFENISFEKVPVSPADNPYTVIKDYYYMPKVVI